VTKYLGMDFDTVDEFEDLPTVSMYNARPVVRVQLGSGDTPPNEIGDFLVPLADHTHHALVSERLYAHWGRAASFHKGEGLNAGYGDGHVSFLQDRDGSRFLNSLAITRENSTYYVDDDDDGDLEDGVWRELDLGP